MNLPGLCQLITMRDRIPELEEYAPKIFPSLIMLFEGLKRAYEQAKEDEECKQTFLFCKQTVDDFMYILIYFDLLR